jgi:hypothetical protein
MLEQAQRVPGKHLNNQKKRMLQASAIAGIQDGEINPLAQAETLN